MKRIVSLFLSAIMLISLFSFAFGVNAAAEEKDYGINNTGNTYFVDSQLGNDKNDGLSEATPWKTLNNVNNTTFEPGSAILLKRGCVWSDTFLWPKGTGDAENKNYISCYGDENDDLPYIDSEYNDELDGLPVYDACFSLSTDQNYWEISNLSLYNGTNSTGTQSVVKLYNANSINRMKGNVVRDCIINGSNPNNWSVATRSGLGGISVEGFVDDVLIENNEISNVKATGITVNGWRSGCDYNGTPNQTSAKGVVIRGNSLYNIGKDGIITNNCLEPLVEYNVCGRAHSYAKNTAHVAMWPFACYGALYQYNEAYETKTIYDGQGFDCDYLCYYTTFQYNYSHDNQGGFMLICTEAKADWLSPSYAYNVGSTVRYNISQSDMHYVFNLTDAIDDTRIYNNTIYASRNLGSTSTNLFFSYDKGQNILNKRNLPNNTLVANNIFYLDTMSSFSMANNTETVVKNNLFCGKNYNSGPADGEVTKKTDSSGNVVTDEDGNEIYCYREVADNIRGADPLFVDGGAATMGRESCDVYQLYEGSPAIGNGIYIEDGFHECPTDFFGNAIDKATVNIGAYAGKGISRDESTYIYDGKYYSMLDFEDETVDEKGMGTNGKKMSGISRLSACTDTDTAFVSITDTPYALNPATKSTKALRFKNTGDKTQTITATFYTYPYDLRNANGLRVYLNPNGQSQTYTFKMTVLVDGSEKTYNESITTEQAGYHIITFNQKYDNSDNKRVDTEIMRTMRKLAVGVSLGVEREVYIDDIQINNGEMDEEESAKNFTYEDAETTLIEDFNSYSEQDDTSFSNAWSGPNGTPRGGIRTCPNGTSAVILTSLSDKNTSYTGGVGHTDTMNKLKSVLAEDADVEGIQFNIYTIATVFDKELTDEQLYSVFESLGAYTIKINGANLSFTTPGGNTKTGNSFQTKGNAIQTDKNGLVRMAFNELYFEYSENSTTYKKYLNEFSEEEQETWKQGITSISFKHTTVGATIGGTVSQIMYFDNLAVYKNVKHDFSDWTVKVKPTCTTDGFETIYCKTCNYVSQSREIAALGHSGGEWETLQELTCTQDGSYQQKCTVCERIIDTKTETAQGHNYVETVVPPSCVEEGYTIDICSCGDEQNKRNIVPATGHTKTKWVIDVAPTCTDNGSSHEECEICGEILQTAVELAGHRYVNTVVEPTCTEDGYTLHKCKICDYEYVSDKKDAEGHKMSSEWLITQNATCTLPGIRVKNCTVCSTVLETESIPVTGHNISSEWLITKNATCTSPGTKVKECTVCNAVLETVPIPATGHNPYVKGMSTATYFNTGYTGDTYCSLCNQKLSSGVTLAIQKLVKPVIKKAAKSKGKVTLSFNKVEGATGYEIRINKGGKWQKFTTTKLKYTLKKLNKNKKYKVKIRAFVKSGTEIKYSSYSKTKTVKCK